MNIIQKITALTLSIGILMSASSCVVLLDKKHDNGKHKGHYKSWPKKKHHPGSVIIIKDNNGNNGNHNGHSKKGGQKSKGGNGHKGKK